MRAEIVAVTHHMILPDDFKRKKITVPGFPKIILEKRGSELNFIDNHLNQQLGIMQVEEVQNSVCLYTHDILEEKNLNPFESSFRDYTATFIDALWLIKDNSIGSEFELCKIDGLQTHYTRRVFINSNSRCGYSDVKFNRGEIEQAIEWFNLFVKVILQSPNIDFYRENSEITDGIINLDKGYPYNKTNRFQRTLRFISIARKQTDLHARITYYISALESLLSTSETALAMQVADRSARILGANYDEKVRIKKTVSIAYSFRSSYIHGSIYTERKMKKDLKFLGSIEELAEEIDEVLRRLIKLYLTDLSHVITLSEEQFALWIDKLLYG